MKKLILSLVAALCFQSLAFADSIQVLNAPALKQVSYTSAELNGSLPNWVIDGKVLPLSQAKKLILEQGKIACATWLMNYSDESNASKEKVQEALLQPSKVIPLWKVVSGRPIYVDPDTSFGISFVCASKNEYGDLVEVDSTDFAKMFAGLYLFKSAR